MSRDEPSEICTLPSNHRGPFYVRNQRLFILHWHDGTFIVPDYCTHRGGPLSLGTCNKEKDTIVCPWHGHHNRIKPLLEKALPAVRIGNSISFLFTREQE